MSAGQQPKLSLGTARAKLILFGEHAVVYGEPALGFALARGVEARLRPGRGLVRTKLAEGLTAPRASRALPEELVLRALGDRADDFDLELELGVPPQAGLGTSAAIAIAVLRALHTMEEIKCSPEELLDQVIGVEDLAHGRSSGLDPAICIYGGLIRFRREGSARSIERIQPVASFHLIVGVAQPHEGTGAGVARIRGFHTAGDPLVHGAIRMLGELTRIGGEALIRHELDVAGRAMDLAHGILSGLGLVDASVEKLVRTARAEGALGAKMSGAGGGGGAMFALAPDIHSAQRIMDRLTLEGAISFIETVA